jgi:hypothetical protein
VLGTVFLTVLVVKTISGVDPVSASGLQFSDPRGAAGWARISGLAPVAEGASSLLDAGSLAYRPLPSGASVYPTEGIRTTDGLYLSPALARLYGVRHVDVGRGGTTLKGAALVGKMALFTGAVASSYGWVDEKTAFWIAGGAAVVGSFYGLTVGYEQSSWREEWRWPEETRDDRP